MTVQDAPAYLFRNFSFIVSPLLSRHIEGPCGNRQVGKKMKQLIHHAPSSKQCHCLENYSEFKS